MADSVPMTLRIDGDLKAASERAAEASGLTLTEFVTRALRGANNPSCPTCGRSSQVATLPIGFTDAFKSFYAQLCGPATNTPFYLITLEGHTPKIYWGRLSSIRPLPEDAGVIEMDAILGWAQPPPGWNALMPSNETYRVLIPRGWIQGWGYDQDGRFYIAQCDLGYEDGNEPARRSYRALMSRLQESSNAGNQGARSTTKPRRGPGGPR